MYNWTTITSRRRSWRELRLGIVDWVYFKTQILLVTLKTRNQPREEPDVSSDVERLFPEVEVQEANVGVSQFHRIGSYLFGCCFANGWNACSRFIGCGDRSVAFVEQQEILTQDVATNASSSQGDSQLYIFEDNEAVIKMIIKGRQKPNDETRVQNPQSRIRLVV